MSKKYCVTLSIIKEILVEVEDNQSDDDALQIALDNTSYEWADAEIGEIPKDFIANNSMYDDCFLLNKADGKG